MFIHVLSTTTKLICEVEPFFHKYLAVTGTLHWQRPRPIKMACTELCMVRCSCKFPLGLNILTVSVSVSVLGSVKGPREEEVTGQRRFYLTKLTFQDSLELSNVNSNFVSLKIKVQNVVMYQLVGNLTNVPSIIQYS